MNFKIFLYITLAFTAFLFSCSKDKDDIKPTIVVYSPVYAQEVNGIDTVQVIASISDNQNIEWVSVSLRDQNNIPVLSTVTKTPNTKDYELNIFYFFDDILLPSGEYNLTVSAFDGENTTNEYVSILLDETPKERNGIFVLSNSGTSSVVDYVDNTFSGSFYKSFNGNYLGLDVNSHDQQLIHASNGALSGEMVNSYNIKIGTDAWSFQIPNTAPIPYYTSFLYDDRSIYLGKRNGGVAGYGDNGVSNFNSVGNGGFSVGNILVHDDKMITVEYALTGGVVRLIPYWMNSGGLTGVNAGLPTNEDVLGLFTKSVNDIVVISNDASLNGNLTYYNPITGALTPYSIGLGQIDDCIAIDIGVYLVVHSGEISLINTNSGFPFLTPTSFISGASANKIWYDDLTNELFVASGSVLNIYDYSSKSFKGSYTHTTGTIKELAFWYNK